MSFILIKSNNIVWTKSPNTKMSMHDCNHVTTCLSLQHIIWRQNPQVIENHRCNGAWRSNIIVTQVGFIGIENPSWWPAIPSKVFKQKGYVVRVWETRNQKNFIQTLKLMQGFASCIRVNFLAMLQASGILDWSLKLLSSRRQFDCKKWKNPGFALCITLCHIHALCKTLQVSTFS